MALIKNLTIALTTSLAALIAWSLLALFFAYAKNLPRIQFIILHYIVIVSAFAVVFFFYYRYMAHFSPFLTMATAMLFLFALEFIVFGFLYEGEKWFLNFVDWIVPAFLIASTIYFIGKLYR